MRGNRMNRPAMPHSFSPFLHTQEATARLPSVGKKDDDEKRIWTAKISNNHCYITWTAHLAFHLFFKPQRLVMCNFLGFCSLRMRHTFFSSRQDPKTSLMILPSGTQSGYFRAFFPVGSFENFLRVALALHRPCQLNQLKLILYQNDAKLLIYTLFSP